MKPDPQPAPFKKFENALRKVLSVPKSEVDKRAKADKKTSSGDQKPKD